MKLALIAVGRAKPGPERDLFQLYAGRMRAKLDLIEVEERRKLPAAELMAAENALLWGAVPKGAIVWALDRRGAALDSAGLAKKLQRLRDGGAPILALLIGGADGLNEATLKRASFTLSMGPMTFPHMLARAMLAEQLYRAQQIDAGHPYHRG